MRTKSEHSHANALPSDWITSTVGEEFDIKLGKMLDSQKNVGVAKPYLGNRAIQWGRIDVDELPLVPLSQSDLETFRLRQGDLLVCEGGDVGRAAIWTAPIAECYYQKALHRLRPLKGFNVELMAAILRHWSEIGLLNNYVTQTSIAHLPREKFLQIPLPVPPENEQRAIAKALSDVDALIATLDRLIAKKRDIKQATMQQLLTGKTRLPGFSGKWESKRLTDMADIIKGNTLSKSLLSESGINPCILYGELFTTYGRVITKTVSFTNSPEGVKSLSGDVLLPGSTTTTGADLATASALLLDGVALGGDINIVRQKGIGYDPAFLACYLTHVARNEIAELAQGTTIHHLYGKDLKGLSLSLPHHTEQSAIASVISDMDTELTAMEARRDKTRAIKQGMMQELLTGKTRLI